MRDNFDINAKLNVDFDLFHKMQEASIDNDDIIVSVDKDGDVEFEMELDVFLDFLKDALEQ